MTPSAEPLPAFPEGDDSLSRTLVFDSPSERMTVQVLVTLWASGEVDVAQRAAPGASWSPPWTLKEVEAW